MSAITPLSMDRPPEPPDGSPPPDPPRPDGASAGEPRGVAGRRRSEAPYLDVWSRTEPKYRVRAILLLFVNLGLFCGLCVFTYWLREARLFDFSWDSFVAPAAFWNPNAPSLDDFLTEPISVERTPLHAIVLGLLFGALITVPICIAILYRFPFCLPFVAAVVIFAHMPWFALMLLAGCTLASVRPLRLSFRYGSALVGLLPVLLYLLVAGGRTDATVSASSPAHLTLLSAPWLLAILAAAAMMAVILQFARLVNYRPGTVAPAVAVMFATPVLLFHAGVGVDELDYRVLERRYGPHSELFAPQQDARPMLFALLRRIVNDPDLLERYESDVLSLSRGEPLANPRRLLNYFTLDFQRERSEAYEASRKFVHDYPTSRYVPCVLYLQALVLDTRLDEQQLHRRAPVRSLYSDFPHVQSHELWSELLRRGDSPALMSVAALRSAQHLLRAGQVDAAVAALQTGLGADSPETRSAAGRPPRPEDSLHVETDAFRLEARRLLELIEANRGVDGAGDAALVELASLDPRRPTYSEQLLNLISGAVAAPLYDNLLVLFANGLPDGAERATALARLAERLPRGDAASEALYRLANLELQAATQQGDPTARRRAIAHLEQVRRLAPQSVWATQAERLLRVYAPLRAE
jgi:hypothetical protein